MKENEYKVIVKDDLIIGIIKCVVLPSEVTSSYLVYEPKHLLSKSGKKSLCQPVFEEGTYERAVNLLENKYKELKESL